MILAAILVVIAILAFSGGKHEDQQAAQSAIPAAGFAHAVMALVWTIICGIAAIGALLMVVASNPHLFLPSS